MPFTNAEKRDLAAAHPDKIIMKVMKGGGGKVVLIPKEHRAKTIMFGNVEIELSMLHGATYWIGGDDGVDGVAYRTFASDQLIPGDRFRDRLRRSTRKGSRKKGR